MSEYSEEKKYKRISKIVLTVIGLLMLFLGYRATHLQFDYDFEKFFPQEDEGLVFYKKYRETFENDNDFILLGIKNESGLFNQAFFDSVHKFTLELRELPHLREVISPFELTFFEISPMGLGFKEVGYFHPQAPELYKQDSVRLLSNNEPIAEMVSIENSSIVLVVKNVQFISKEKSDELATELLKVVDAHYFDEVHLFSLSFIGFH